jgi:Fe-Mn family superoxide dismutase
LKSLTINKVYIMPFTLPALPYAFNALEPHIDARTMEIHHGKHHQAYITNLNNALAGSPDENASIESICANISKYPMAVRNNGGGHFNHSFFWTSLSPNGGESSAELKAAIDSDLGGMEKMKEEFAKAGTSRFGSGWAWICLKDGKLTICSTANQDNPLMDVGDSCHGIPLLGLDVWEHAYYLNYQNRRPDYIAAFWNVVNWAEVSRRYSEAKA